MQNHYNTIRFFFYNDTRCDYHGIQSVFGEVISLNNLIAYQGINSYV